MKSLTSDGMMKFSLMKKLDFALDKSSFMLFLLLLLFLPGFLNVRNKCLIGLGCDMAQ